MDSLLDCLGHVQSLVVVLFTQIFFLPSFPLFALWTLPINELNPAWSSGLGHILSQLLAYFHLFLPISATFASALVLYRSWQAFVSPAYKDIQPRHCIEGFCLISLACGLFKMYKHMLCCRIFSRVQSSTLLCPRHVIAILQHGLSIAIDSKDSGLLSLVATCCSVVERWRPCQALLGIAASLAKQSTCWTLLSCELLSKICFTILQSDRWLPFP